MPEGVLVLSQGHAREGPYRGVVSGQGFQGCVRGFRAEEVMCWEARPEGCIYKVCIWSR